MKTCYERLVVMTTDFSRYIGYISMISSAQEIKKTQANLLRQRYYSNLSFLDLMAKNYGEMGFFKQISLYMLSLGLLSSGVIFINPVCFIMGAISINLLVYISLQYRTLEARFSRIVCDFEASEKSLEIAVAANKALTIQIIATGVKQDKLMSDLEDGYLEISRQAQSLDKNQQMLVEACEIIEQSAEKSVVFIEKIVELEADTKQKGAQCVELLDGLAELVMHALDDLQHISVTPMAKKLAEQKEHLTRLDTYLNTTFADDLADTGNYHHFFKA